MSIPSSIPPKREGTIGPSVPVTGTTEGRTLAVEEGKTVSRVSSTIEGLEIPHKALSEREIETVSTSASKEPKTAKDYFELGKNYFEKKDMVKAKDFFSEAIKFQPSDSQVLAEIAIIYQNSDSQYADLGDIAICQLLFIDDEQPPNVTLNFDAQTLLDNINQLPENQKANAMARFATIQEMAQEAKLIIDDNWTSAYTNNYIEGRLMLRKTDIINQIADQLELQGNPAEGILIDPKTGKQFNDLRGENSVVEKLAELIKSVGGDYAIIQAYLDEQKGDSWHFLPQVLKVHIAKNRTLSEEDSYYWKEGYPKAENKYNNYMQTGDQKVFEKTFCVCHAFTTEMLNKMDVPGKDNEQKTIRVYRTESLEVLRNGECEKTVDESFTNRIQRGALESGSIVAPVVVYSPEVTTQNVPIHRFFWTYLPRNPDPSADPNKTCLYANDEMEVNFIPEYIPFAWTYKS